MSARLTGAHGGTEEKPSRIIATDVEHKVLEMLALNIAENRVQARKLDWELAGDAQHNAEELAAWEHTAWDSGGRASLVLGADIVYDPSLVGPLSATLGWLLRPDTTIAPEALVAGTLRNEATWRSFLSACQFRLRDRRLALANCLRLIAALPWQDRFRCRTVYAIAQFVIYTAAATRGRRAPLARVPVAETQK